VNVSSSPSPDSGIVGAVPAARLHAPFSEDESDRLPAVAWWDWPVELVTEHVRSIMSGGIADLEAAAPDTPRV
jgi:virginiamycin A acetyltransferase